MKIAKIALVTGGSKGIGLSVVKRFVANKYTVVTCGRSRSTWDDAVSQYPYLNDVDFVECDISSSKSVDGLFEYITKRYGRIDMAINNASPQIASVGEFINCDPDALLDTLNSDFLGPALCIQQEMKLMSSGGCIVNVTSVNGIRPTPNAAMYGASKQGIESLTRSLALEAIPQGIRINSVAPGVTWTERWEQRACDNPELRSEIEALVPSQRFAEPDEVAGAIEWLCSPAADYVVGHTLVIDGGLSLK